jgi:hypothetical protein
MITALVTSALLLTINVVGVRLVDAARPGPRPRQPLLHFVLQAAFAGAAVYLTSILFEASWSGSAMGGALVLMHAVRVGRPALAWRRFFLALDDACTTPDRTRIERLLGLSRPPLGYGAHETWVTRILLAAHRAHELEQTERAIAWLDAFDLPRLTQEQAAGGEMLRERGLG